MSRGWNRTELYIGESVDLPDEVYQSREAKSRLLYSKYYGETDTGMIFEVGFPYGRYDIFIMFAAVYCGAVKIKRADGTMLHIERKQGRPKIRNFEGRSNYGKDYIE